MKRMPQPALELEPTEPELIQGWLPIAFEETPLIEAGATHTMRSDFLQRPVRGPYLFRFDEPRDLNVSFLQCGTYALPATASPFNAETLIANTETSELGDQFFPIDGPNLYPGQVIQVTVQNASGRRRRVSLTVYARSAEQDQ